MSCSTHRSDWDHLHRLVYCKTPECSYAQGGECMDRCGLLHRVHTTDLPDDRAAVVMGRTEELPIQFAEEDPEPSSRWRSGLEAWRIYRGVGCGLRESFRNAVRAFRSQS